MANTNGWISLHRKIQDHWIWKDSDKFKWWVDILLTVNTTDAKVNIGFKVFECKRGQSLLSLSSWAQRWKVGKDTARNFLKLLESQGMITHVNLTKTTLLTVCNYDSYQQGLHVNQTHYTRKPNASQTHSDPNNNNNKDNNEEQVKKEKKEKVDITRLLFATGGEVDLFSPLKEIYLNFYKTKCGDGEYYFQAVDGAKLKSILKKLFFKMKEKSSGQKESFTGHEVSEAMLFLLTKGYDTADDWTKANFTLTTIDTKFNTIFTAIKNEGTTATKRNGHATTDDVLAVVSNMFSGQRN